jgi:hypothetical protein
MKTLAATDYNMTHVHGSAVTQHELWELARLWDDVGGNIVEVGTQCGQTSRALAMHAPQRIVFTVDTLHPCNLCDVQKPEQPTLENVAWHCRGLPNVFVSLDGFESFRMENKDIRMAFIDGDHTFDGVCMDTAKVLNYAVRTGRKFVIAWHDYNVGDDGWCGVYRVVEHLHSSGRISEHSHVSGTRLAFTVINPQS